MLNNHIGISASRHRVFLAHVKPNAPVRERRRRAAVAILKAKKRFVAPCPFAKKECIMERNVEFLESLYKREAPSVRWTMVEQRLKTSVLSRRM